jgi:hypothetical protein
MEIPIVVSASQEEIEVLDAKPPAKTLSTKPDATTNESRIITFLKYNE